MHNVSMNRFLLVIFYFSAFSASAQDLTGIWRGHFRSGNYARIMDSLGIDDRYKFETQIAQGVKGFEGVTYSYKTTVFYGKAACVGTVSQKTKKVILGETKLLEVKSEGGGACLMTCFLQYSKVGNEEFLEGSYTSISVRDSTQCGGGTVFLRKVATSDFYKEPFLAELEKKKTTPPPAETKPKTVPPKTAPPVVKKSSPPAKKPAQENRITKTPPPAKIIPEAKKNESLKQLYADSPEIAPPARIAVPRVLATRANELVKTITSSAKEVTIKIYDNGTIDNDTVSVYVDNKLVISRQRLTDKAITMKINLDDGAQFHELVMVAENLGEIPPNTSLMVVTAGDQRHEVRITSNEQKNAVIRFSHERPAKP